MDSELKANVIAVDEQEKAATEELRKIAQEMRNKHPQTCAAQQGNKCDCGLIT